MRAHSPMRPQVQNELKNKQLVEKEKETVKPTVINDRIIKEYLLTYNRENKIFDEDEKPIWELEHLSLSFKNIISIGNLDGMDKLQKLQLDNNIITKIQGLDRLVELRWLDLSFNMIEKIENLNKLKKLEDLSLFSNKITKLEGLEELTNLNVLSVGSNELDNLDDQVLYLHNLNNRLEVLKINQNKFKEEGGKEYKNRIIAYLKNLKYLDYELIDEKLRGQADSDFRTELESNQIND